MWGVERMKEKRELRLYILLMNAESNTVEKEVLIEYEREKLEGIVKTIEGLKRIGKVKEK